MLVVAADASDHKGGAVLVPKDGYMQLLGDSFTFPKNTSTFSSRSHIVLLEDNTAVAGCTRLVFVLASNRGD